MGGAPTEVALPHNCLSCLRDAEKSTKACPEDSDSENCLNRALGQCFPPQAIAMLDIKASKSRAVFTVLSVSPAIITSYPCTRHESITITKMIKEFPKTGRAITESPLSLECSECWNEIVNPLVDCSMGRDSGICAQFVLDKCFSPLTTEEMIASKSSAAYTVGAVALLVGLLL